MYTMYHKGEYQQFPLLPGVRRWSPLRVDPLTGTVRVARALQRSASPLKLLVGAVDSGSPQRYAVANLTIYIREIPGE